MNSEEILRILDSEADRFAFPMLDNGYFYLAAARLSLFRSTADWGIAIEIFNFNPRAGCPATDLYFFASRIHRQKSARDYVSDSAHQDYLRDNPYYEFVTIHPLDDGQWMDADDPEFLAPSGAVRLRDEIITLPDRREYDRYGIDLSEDRPSVSDFCRYLAAIRRDKVLATPQERRCVVPPEMTQILQLEEWHHPDLLHNEKPSATETFQQLAKVLESGNASIYDPTEPPNTHWSNWPHGGTL